MLRLLVLAAMLALPTAVDAAMLRTQINGVVITLYFDPCPQHLRNVATNLPMRALWEEKGVKTEGCWQYWQPLGVIGAYFADRTVALMPAQIFVRAQEASAPSGAASGTRGRTPTAPM